MAAAAATAHQRGATGRQVAPAPQLRDDNSAMSAEQAEALKKAQEEALKGPPKEAEAKSEPSSSREAKRGAKEAKRGAKQSKPSS